MQTFSVDLLFFGERVQCAAFFVCLFGRWIVVLINDIFVGGFDTTRWGARITYQMVHIRKKLIHCAIISLSLSLHPHSWKKCKYRAIVIYCLDLEHQIGFLAIYWEWFCGGNPSTTNCTKFNAMGHNNNNNIYIRTYHSIVHCLSANTFPILYSVSSTQYIKLMRLNGGSHNGQTSAAIQTTHS